MHYLVHTIRYILQTKEASYIISLNACMYMCSSTCMHLMILYNWLLLFVVYILLYVPSNACTCTVWVMVYSAFMAIHWYKYTTTIIDPVVVNWNDPWQLITFSFHFTWYIHIYSLIYLHVLTVKEQKMPRDKAMFMYREKFGLLWYITEASMLSSFPSVCWGQRSRWSPLS